MTDISKDGKGNIVISEELFGKLLGYVSNNKFTNKCKKILNQKLIFETISDDYYLVKRYEHQSGHIEWTWDDVLEVRKLFKGTRLQRPPEPPEIHNDGGIPYWRQYVNGESKIDESYGNDQPMKADHGVEPEPEIWYIERNVFSSESNLTISEDGSKNRPWAKSEIDKIEKHFNNLLRKEKLKKLE